MQCEYCHSNWVGDDGVCKSCGYINESGVNKVYVVFEMLDGDGDFHADDFHCTSIVKIFKDRGAAEQFIENNKENYEYGLFYETLEVE